MWLVMIIFEITMIFLGEGILDEFEVILIVYLINRLPVIFLTCL